MESLKSEIINYVGFIPVTSRFKNLYIFYDKTIIEHALKLSNGSQLRAARIMGISRNTMSRKVKVYGIDYRKYRPV
jgi:DNA-binding NtrC family response regulator